MAGGGHFDDIGNLGGNFGVFDGLGAADHHQVRETRLPDNSGTRYQCRCDNCGQPTGVDVNWDEFIYLSAGGVPPGWAYDAARGASHPNAACRACGGFILMTFTPDEAGRQLKGGMMSGAVPKAYVAKGQAQVQQMTARMGR